MDSVMFDCIFFHLETGSILDSHDVSYLNDIHYRQYQRGRRRIESASDMHDQSLNSDDVMHRFWIAIFVYISLSLQ